MLHSNGAAVKRIGRRRSETSGTLVLQRQSSTDAITVASGTDAACRARQLRRAAYVPSVLRLIYL